MRELRPLGKLRGCTEGGGAGVGAVVDGGAEEFAAVAGNGADEYAVIIGGRGAVAGPFGSFGDPGFVDVQNRAAAPGCG
ncbi:hypothetical protein AB0G71_20425 [Streptomyces sp. NPDC020403]|uniref:hypothetical protein n=1 Tax=unclassified Streptomyces TaxID=2593676 RepID=UPI0033EC9D7A